jgi:predicted O-linked N-acetylglucosamine transferase (SPINDLY family)
MKAKVKSNNPTLKMTLSKAMAFHQSGDIEAAEKVYKNILKSNPDNFDALHLLGVIAGQKGNDELAIDLISKAIIINSKDARSHYNLGFSLQKLKYYELALTCYEQAILLEPNYAVAFSNRASIFKELGKFDVALESYNQALTLSPGNAEDYSNRAVVLTSLHRAEEAIADCEQAILLLPTFHKAHYNLGLALLALKKIDEAVLAFSNALTLYPQYEYLSGLLLHTQMKLCAWQDFQDKAPYLIEKIHGGKKVSSAFPIFAFADDLVIQRKSAEIWSDDKHPYNSLLGQITKHPRHPKIRLGYFSADFHNHATAYLMAELFERHDKDKFELIAFSFGPETKDEMQLRVSQAFDHFINVASLSDLEIALLSRELGIDIAIDLKGVTQDYRLSIFSYRAAPIQVSYLGYPGTLGADYIDYLIADKTLIPRQSQQHYSEKIVYLPNSYQVNDRHRVIAPTQFTKKELGLPEDAFVFCCFNNNFKITPDIFDSWVRILKAVDSSVLWLLQDNPTAAMNLQKEAASRGLDPARLVFAKRMDLPEHLARHKAADLFLDTTPCNAHTTASDALWAGLPLLTCMGESFASRVAASLLNAIGLPELVTESLVEYEALAITLATTPVKLKTLKEKLERNRLTTPLFNTELFTKHIEEAYTQIYERYQADLPPEYFEVF